MGVRGLWQLLLPIGRRISIETLGGRTLAVDASIWMTQFLKAMRDPDTGKVQPNAHLVGFLRRIVKLLYHGIRPVFVFDGQTPLVKLREIQARRERREGKLRLLGKDDDDDDGENARHVKRLARRILVSELKKNKKKLASSGITAAVGGGGGGGAAASSTTDVADEDHGTKSPFASGFNLPEEEEEELDGHTGPSAPSGKTGRSDANDAEEAVIELIDSDDDDRKVVTRSNDASPPDGFSSSDVDTGAPLEGDGSNAPKKKKSDWDDVVDSSSSGTEDGGGNDKREEDDAADDDAYVPSPASSSDEEVDVEAVAHLPPDLRKDGFERAKRHQRMQSRREFMPVAADPHAYSQVQLRNFLRGSRLNKKIERLSTEAAARSSGGDGDDEVGERIASDTTRRIIFTKDGGGGGGDGPTRESRTTSTSSYLDLRREESVGGTDHRHPSPRRRRRRLRRKGDAVGEGDGENDSDEDPWREEDREESSGECEHLGSSRHTGADEEFASMASKVTSKPASTSKSSRRSRVRGRGFFVDDGDSDEAVEGTDATDWAYQDRGNRGSATYDGDSRRLREEDDSKRSAQVLEDEMLARALQEAEDEDGPGGEEDGHSGGSTVRPRRPIHDGGSDDSDGGGSDDGGGGFMPPTSGGEGGETGGRPDASPEDGNDDESGGGFLPPVAAPPVDEDEDGGGIFHRFGCGPGPPIGASLAEDDARPLNGGSVVSSELLDADAALAARLQAEEDRGGGNGSSSRAIDLTEGDENDTVHDVAKRKSENAVVEDRRDQAKMEKMRDSQSEQDSDSDVDWEDGDEGADKTDLGKRNVSVASESSSGNDSDIDWEEGDVKDASKTDASNSGVVSRKHDAGVDAVSECAVVSREGADVELPSGKDDSAAIEIERRASGESSAVRCNSPIYDDDRDEEALSDQSDDNAEDTRANGFENPMFDANEAALIHAQETAANLTTWAGRAVQRAIAAHMAGSKSGHSHGSADSALNARSAAVRDDATSSYTSTETDRAVKGSAVINANELETEEASVAASSDIAVSAEFARRKNLDAGAKAASAFLDGSSLSLEELQDKEDALIQERNRQQRDMDTVSDDMKEEVVELLQCFGIPYVEAPAEAEAQCATMEDLGLVDGIVTEDSDVFVFGGKTVYKNIFDEKKFVEVYLAADAEKELALGRNQMIALAMLLGGDYTDGVKGVGIVNGMEVLQAFPTIDSDLREGLTQFRNWLDGFDPGEEIGLRQNGSDSGNEQISQYQVFHRKHRSARTRWIAPKDFPAPNVLTAYAKPVVDKSTARFSWGMPDVDSLKRFCYQKMGWPLEETDRLVLPVVEKMKSGVRQTRLESFFMTYHDNIKFANVRSKRLKEVIRNIQSGEAKAESSGDEDESKATFYDVNGRPKRAKRTQTPSSINAVPKSRKRKASMARKNTTSKSKR